MTSAKVWKTALTEATFDIDCSLEISSTFPALSRTFIFKSDQK